MSQDAGDNQTGRIEVLKSRIRFGKFISVGIVGAVFDTIVLIFLTEVVGLLEEVALLIGIETAVLIMFLINDNWTFAAESKDGWQSFLVRLTRSHAVRAGGIITQFIVFVIIFRLLFVPITVSGIDLWLLVAKGIGVGCGMLVNYTFESLFTWQVHKNR